MEDYHQISQLAYQYGLSVKSEEEWKHLWVDNPAYRQLEKKWPMGWVLENKGKQILGSIENIPLLYELGGKKIIVSAGRNWVVHARYRSYSILLLDYYFRQKNVDLFLMGGVNHEAFRAFREFHASPVPAGKWDQSAFWISNYRGFVKSVLIKKAVPMAGFLSYPLSVPLYCIDGFRKNPQRLYRNLVDVTPCTHFDNRFDDFWEALKSTRRDILLGLRTREMLEWHFKYALLRNQLCILTIANGPRLAAYSIFEIGHNPKLGLKYKRLLDFQTLDDNNLLLPMLAWALNRCHHEGIHMLDVWGFHPKKRELIEKLAPHRRKLSWWLYLFRTMNKSLEERLRNPNVWDPCLFDSDSTL